MATDKARPKRRLSRNDWVDAALSALGDGGLAAVAVEPLAARLGATKGSFYWHFPNRDALLNEALARWEDHTTTAVIDEITAMPDDPSSQLRQLIIRVIRTAEADRVGPVLIASASHPAVAPVLARVTRARIGVIVELFESLGFPPDDARRRALLAYSAYLGHAQLAHSTPEVLPHRSEEQRAYLDHALHTLTTR